MGKVPVWSEKIVLVGWKATNALFVFWWRMGGWRETSIFLVDRVFWYCWWSWPRTVLTDGGRCFMMSLLVRPGHVKKKPAFIALIHDVTTGLKQIRWYQMVRFCLLSSVDIWTLLDDCCNFCVGNLWEWDGPMGMRNKFLIGQNFPVRTGFPFCG